jgi:hypothetical protein
VTVTKLLSIREFARATGLGYRLARKLVLSGEVPSVKVSARRRPVAGVEEPIFYRGKKCGAIQRYSDTLLIFLLKGEKPDKYRENMKIEHTGSIRRDRLLNQGCQYIRVLGSVRYRPSDLRAFVDGCPSGGQRPRELPEIEAERRAA